MYTLYHFLFVQLPIGTPNPDDNKPVDFSDPFEVIVIIILPILIGLFYILWRRQKKKDKR